jgi:NTE family protein
MQTHTVSLVLGSGGARGLAHIGVIEWLVKNNFKIRSIAGSSVGALIGGIYAAGQLDNYAHWVMALNRIDVIRLLDLSFSRDGLFKGERIMGVLQGLIGDRNIEDLPISFTAVATDVDAGDEVWLNRGSLFDAIRASIALPTIFTPYRYQNKRLLDGGLVNPVPIAPTLNDNTDLTIAVNLGAKPEAEFNRPERVRTAMRTETRDHLRIKQFIDNLQQRLGGRGSDEMGLFDVVSKSLDIMQTTIARFKLAANYPDVVIDIPRNVCFFYEFHRARELIEVGRHKAEEALTKFVDSPS